MEYSEEDSLEIGKDFQLNTMTQPILSICIPTYNRAHILVNLLDALEEELRSSDTVQQTEIIVLNNASTDNTKEIVKGYQKLPIQYFENAHNIGASANVMKVTKYAKGKYGWIIGDDDLPAQGAVEQIIKTLISCLNIAGIQIGFTHEKAANRAEVIKNKRLLNKNNTSILQKIDNCKIPWQETFRYCHKPHSFITSIVSHVFLLEKWREFSDEYFNMCHGSDYFNSVESTFPHALTWVDVFANEEVLVISEPLVFFFVGEQEWFHKWKTMYFTFVLEIYDHMESNGVKKEVVNELVGKHFRDGEIGFIKLFEEADEYSNKHFLLKNFVTHYRSYPEMWKMMQPAMKSKYGNQILLSIFKQEGLNFYFYKYLLSVYLRYNASKLKYKIKYKLREQ